MSADIPGLVSTVANVAINVTALKALTEATKQLSGPTKSKKKKMF